MYCSFWKKYHIFNEEKEQIYHKKINTSHILPQSPLFHRKPGSIQLPQNLALPFFPRCSTKAGSCPQCPAATPAEISSSAVSWGETWVQVLVKVGLLSVPGVAANVRGRDARAKTKLETTGNSDSAEAHQYGRGATANREVAFKHLRTWC